MSSIVGDFVRSTCRCADSECEHRQEIIPELPTKKADRVKGQIYINKKGEKGTWDGRRLRESCCEDGCNKRPYFNEEGQTTGLYCGDHKKENMINVLDKRCCEDGCNKHPYFNEEGQTTGLYCGVHKKDNMINVVSKRCCEDGCNKHPAFNEEGQTRGLYCDEHKKENMINVVSKRCCEDGCNKRPYFNEEGQTTGLYCALHKKKNMIYVVSKSCCEDGCNKQPNFNYEGKSGGLYCGEHKKENMINVVSKRCCEDGCNKRPYFNEEGQTTGLYCGEHKKKNMIDVVSKSCCEDGCNKYPIFNEEGQKTGLYCAFHKKDNMIDVKNKSNCCKNEGCDTRALPKYEGYCMPCFINNPLNADKPAHRNYKTKEKEVALAITQRFPDATWILDKKIQDGCSARRPDVLMDLGYHVLMVEVDENQHNNYDCSCENKRLMELAQDLGHRSMIVIRFNPDAYETIYGERVPSCWKLNKKGVVHIPKEQQKNWDARIEVLLETIQYWIDNQSEKQIEIVELFYA